MNKVIRFEIIPLAKKEENLSQKSAYEILWKLQREAMEVANHSVQYSWEWFNFSSDYMRQNGEYPSKEMEQGIFGKSLLAYAYNKSREFAPNLASVAVSSISRTVCTNFNSKKADFLRGDVSIPSYKRNYPIPITKSDIRIKHFKKMNNGQKVDDYYVLEVPVLSKQGVETFGTPSTRLSFKMYINAKSGNQKDFLKRCSNVEHYVEENGEITGEPLSEDFVPAFLVTASNIAWDERNKKFFINLGYSFEQKDTELDQDRRMGLQLGYVVPLFCALNDKRDTFCIDQNEIEEFRKRTEARRIALAKQTKYCGDGRVGHGRKKRTDPQRKIGDRISNFRDTCNHKYSRAVVEFAKRNKAGTIVLESLSGIAEDNLFLKTWSYYDLQTKIKNKAAEYGIKVEEIEPQYTSRRCSKCGHINEEEDREKAYSDRLFICECCNFRTSFDKNAAINIATDGIEEIITKQAEEQGLPSKAGNKKSTAHTKTSKVSKTKKTA